MENRERDLKKAVSWHEGLVTAIFGKEDILINNIAWLLRKMPIFPIFGYGSYRLQPIYVQDFAELAVREGRNHDNVIIDAIGPETYSYRSLVEKIGDIIGQESKHHTDYDIPCNQEKPEEDGAFWRAITAEQ